MEILPDRLYYAALKAPPPSHNILASTPRKTKATNDTVEKKQIHFFNMDHELVYWNFFLDFGPLNLGQFSRFALKLQDKLHKFPVVCFYSNTVPAKRANAIFLICAWQIVYLHRSPEQAFCGFDSALTEQTSTDAPDDNSTLNHGCGSNQGETGASASPVSRSQGILTIGPLPPFHDASPVACTYDLTVMDCLRGMHKARSLGFYDEKSFDVEEYEHFEQVENGDLNWIVKDKILAFAGPSFERHVSPEGYCTLAPADYIPYFQRKKVDLVVRLNKKLYHEQDFEQAGIRHMEAFFIDGSCPPMRILQQVLDGFESVPTGMAFAVHCKAGLGRTGTCIGAYLMKHYRFTAAEAIGWMRICRPGCVIGPQQHFLKQIESRMWQEGAASGPIPRSPPFEPEVRKMETDSVEALIGRAGQANALLAARGRRGGKSTVSDPPITPEQQQKGKPVPVTPESKVKLWF